MSKEFDLLGNADHGLKDIEKKMTLNRRNCKKSTKIDRNTLIWHKLRPDGFKLPALEGHSVTSYQNEVYIFGGMIAGMRSNATYTLSLIDTTSLSIMNLDANTNSNQRDDIPCERAYHAAAQYNEYMVIHGGEHISVDTIDYSNVGICPGDSLANTSKYNKSYPVTELSRSASKSMINMDLSAIQNRMIKCLDDMYVLNVKTGQWHKVKSVLSPLPRKGHTLNIITINCVKYFVIFGGFSSDSSLVSNSLHICAVDDVIHNRETVWKRIGYDGIGDGHISGEPPEARYYHSCTVLRNPGGSVYHDVTEVLCVYGGMGAENQVFDDFFVFNVDSLHWKRMPSTHTGGGVNGSIQIPIPLFGHVGFVTNDTVKVASGAYDNKTGVALKKKIKFGNILIFGGKSGATTDMKLNAKKMDAVDQVEEESISNCQNIIYRFSFKDMSWSVVSTGYDMPQPRYCHQVALIKGYTPVHDFPAITDKVDESGVGVVDANKPMALNTTTSAPQKQLTLRENPNVSCVVMVGGVNSIMCPSDIWILDTRFRGAGMDQYDKHYYPTQTMNTNNTFSRMNSMNSLINTNNSAMFSSQRKLQEKLNNNKAEVTRSKTELEAVATATNTTNANQCSEIDPRRSTVNDCHIDSQAIETSNSKNSKHTVENTATVIPKLDATPVKSTEDHRTDGQTTILHSSTPKFDPTDSTTDESVALPIPTSNLHLVTQGCELNSPGVGVAFPQAASPKFNDTFLNTQVSSTIPMKLNDLDPSISMLIQKLRKEAAIANNQSSLDRTRANSLLVENQQLQEKICAIEKEKKETVIKAELEIKCLREALDASLQNERKLEKLNQEAYTLLMLQEIKQL